MASLENQKQIDHEEVNHTHILNFVFNFDFRLCDFV